MASGLVPNTDKTFILFVIDFFTYRMKNTNKAEN